jgi:DHA1 family bicyclomycin/chloramphenicol resistance-like MFS transporter
MFAPKSLATTTVIALLVAVGPLSTDMYLPAFPALAAAFDADIAQVQQTLSIFLIGFAAAQLAYGPLSDRYGRRPVLLAGLLMFFVSSLGIAVADSIQTISLLRLLQAVGGSAGPVLGRAMVRDLYGPRESARLLSYIATAMALAPALAPILGGYMTVWLGWQSIFLFLAGYALIGGLLLKTRIAETAPVDGRSRSGLRNLPANYARLLRHRNWRWYTLACSFVFAGLFAFLSGSSFVIIGFLGYGEEQFGLFFALIVVGFMAGTLVAGRMVQRVGIDALILCGALLATLGGCVMLTLSVAGIHSVWAIVLPHMVYMMGTGMVMPQAMAGALTPFPQIAGTSSALLGFIQMLLAALAGTLVGHYHDGGPLAMSAAICLMGLLTLVSALVLHRTRTRGGVS